MEDDSRNIVFVKKVKEDESGKEYYEVLGEGEKPGLSRTDELAGGDVEKKSAADFVDRKSRGGLIILGVLLVFGIYCTISERLSPGAPAGEIDMKEMLETFRQESGIAVLDSAIRMAGAQDTVVKDTDKTEE